MNVTRGWKKAKITHLASKEDKRYFDNVKKRLGFLYMPPKLQIPLKITNFFKFVFSLSPPTSLSLLDNASKHWLVHLLHIADPYRKGHITEGRIHQSSWRFSLAQKPNSGSLMVQEFELLIFWSGAQSLNHWATTLPQDNLPRTSSLCPPY